jgi:hypothetical protein
MGRARLVDRGSAGAPVTVRAIGLACLAYVAAAVAYTWPLAIKLGGVPHDLGDPVLTAWFLWWSTQAIPLTAEWWNAPMFYPATGVLGFSEHLLGLVPIAAPLSALTGQPLVGHNVAFIATFVLSALGAHFLAYTITRRHDVSAVAAVAFAFAPYRLPQAPHIQVLASFWTPICLAALHRYDRTARPRWAILAAAAWVLQALSCGYYLLFLWVLVVFWLLWFAIGRWPVRQLAIAAAAFIVGALVLVPFIRGYHVILRETYGFQRSIGEIRFFSADIASLLSASDELLVWGWVNVFQRPEANLFPGLVIVLLIAFVMYRTHPFRTHVPEPRRILVVRRVFAGLLLLLLIGTAIPWVYGTWQLTVGGVRLVSIARADKPMTLAFIAAVAVMMLLPRVRAACRRRSTLAFYLLAAFATWVFALGPDPTIMGDRGMYRAPYSWLMLLPGFDGLRVPARFWMMTLACLSVVAALAVDRLSGRTRQVVVALAVAGLLLDGWPRHFNVFPAPPLRPSPSGVTARLNLPIADESDSLTLYQQMFDPVPMFNGFSGYSAPHYYAMRASIEEADQRILQVLAARGPVGVVIDHAGDADGALRRFVLAAPGASVERLEQEWSSYRVPQSMTTPDVPERAGTPIPIKSVAASPNPADARYVLDGNYLTAWRAAAAGQGREVTPEAGEMTIELEQPSPVAQVVLDVGGLIADFPRKLQIDVSLDGSTWEPAWTGSAALHAYHGAIRHPRELPVVLPLNKGSVRFIRLRQPAFGKYPWSVTELHVLR